MPSAGKIAEQAAITHFLNCYIRETGNGEWLTSSPLFPNWVGKVLRLPIQYGQYALYIKVSYWSQTGRHLYDLPAFVSRTEQPNMDYAGQALQVNTITAISILIDQLDRSLEHKSSISKMSALSHIDTTYTSSNQLLYSILLSMRNMEAFIKTRYKEAPLLHQPEMTFLQSEQSLLFGHTFHPAPKSRQGLPEWEQFIYSPETKGKFQLHYFAAHYSLIRQQSVEEQTASNIIRNELFKSLSEDDLLKLISKSGNLIFTAFNENSDQGSRHNEHNYIQKNIGNDEHETNPETLNDSRFTYVLIPTHPVQSEWLRHQPHVQRWLASGQLIDIGPLGKPYYPTSSLRTVYDPESQYMYKFSLPIKITNSVRMNKVAELDTAIEAAQLMKAISSPLGQRYPNFRLMNDSASLTLTDNGPNSISTQPSETGFEMLIRQNPFYRDSSDGTQAIVLAALTQPPIDDTVPLAKQIIAKASQLRKASMAELCVEWFRHYLSLSLEPMVWLYMEYGVALEAHLQNGVLVLDSQGMPESFFYRDNQGYYYAKSMVHRLERFVPGISESHNTFDDKLVEERFGYYLIINHMMGVIQSFGAAGVIDERVLVLELHTVIRSLLPLTRPGSTLLQNWLSNRSIRCKANLLTRLYDIDELDNELEQAIYVHVNNPLYLDNDPEGEGKTGGIRWPNTDLLDRAKRITAHWRKQKAEVMVYGKS